MVWLAGNRSRWTHGSDSYQVGYSAPTSDRVRRSLIRRRDLARRDAARRRDSARAAVVRLETRDAQWFVKVLLSGMYGLTRQELVTQCVSLFGTETAPTLVSELSDDEVRMVIVRKRLQMQGWSYSVMREALQNQKQ